MNANTRYEIIAPAFQKDTGFMAPGKSVPDCMYQDENRRASAWVDWIDKHRDIINNLISSFEHITEIDDLEEELRLAKMEAEDAKNERNKIEFLTRREVMAEMDSGENGLAFREAKRLAESIWRTEFKDEAPAWEALDTTAGIISQIDNMYAGMRQQRDQFRFEADRSRFWNCNFESSPKKEGKYAVIVKDLVGQGQLDAQWIGGEWHLPESVFPAANMATITHWRSL